MRRLRFALPLALATLAAALFVAGAAAYGVYDEEPLPVGTVGQAYSYQFRTVPTESRPGESFNLHSGALPPGLSLNSSGRLSGTPTTAGSWSFYIQAGYDSSVGRRTSERQFTVNVIQGLAIQQTSLPTPVVGAPYSQQLTATGGGNQTWSVSAGALPAGLALSGSGLISGTPTTVGGYSFTARVTDGARSATQAFSGEVLEALKLAAPQFPPAVVGSDFTATFTATGGRGPYTFAVAEGSVPRGVPLSAQGVLAGRPRVAGTYSFAVKVTDSLGNATTLPSTLVVQPRLKIPVQTLRPGQLGKRYSARILARGGAAPLTFELADGDLPSGVRLNARTGALVGTPRTKGRFAFAVVVADQIGNTHQRRFVLRVR